MPTGWLLAVDFGTSNTAAAHVNEMTGAVQTLPLSHASNLMPSSVFVASPTQIDVGDVAMNNAASDPTSFIPAPKRSLTSGEDSFRVGSWDVPAAMVVAGVLRSVLMRAQGQHQGRPPSGLVLTHPENWSPQQVRVLTEAANSIGYPANLVWTVSEPRAAANYYARSSSVTPGDKIAVFDFGGGTLDVAVLAAGPDGSFQVVAAQGDNALGGRNFDAAIRRWVDEQLSERNPELLQHFRQQATMREAKALDDAIRAAKEVLSEAPQATIEVAAGGQHEMLMLTRREFEGLIEREVARGVDLARNTFRGAAVGPEGVRALYLTGGSSRIPLVHQQLQQLGQIATLDDPKTVVAQGALIAATRQAAPPQPAAPQQLPPQHQPAQQWSSGTSSAGKATKAGGGLSRGKLVGAGVAVLAVVGIAVGVVLSQGGGSKSPTASAVSPSATTSQPDAATNDAATALNSSPSSASAVLAALPPKLRNEVSCSQDKTQTSKDSVYVTCRPNANDQLFAGLINGSFSDENFTAQIVSAPEKYRSDTKNQLMGGKVLKDDGDVFVTFGVAVPGDFGYLHMQSGLSLSFLDFKDAQSVQTFMTRAGL